MMDLVSWLLALIGLNNDGRARQTDQKAEVFRLTAEVAAEASRAIDILNEATPHLLRRCRAVCSDEPDAFDALADLLHQNKRASEQVLALAEENKRAILTMPRSMDWEKALFPLYEWRATCSRLPSAAQDVVNRCERILDGADRQL